MPLQIAGIQSTHSVRFGQFRAGAGERGNAPAIVTGRQKVIRGTCRDNQADPFGLRVRRRRAR